MKLSILEIANILQCQKPTHSHTIQYVSIDSRQILQARQTLFFALSGSQTDGHLYISELYKKGVRNFVVRQIPSDKKYKGANFLLVKNRVRALQKLATYYRKSLSAKVIAITGSNGKTVVKEWLATLLQSNYKTAKNPKSYNSQIGVPLSIFQISEKDEFAILEAGISKEGEMNKLEKIIAPDLGIFTNIGSAHDEGFADQKTKILEKLKLFKKVKELVISADQKWIDKDLFSKKTVLLDWSKTSNGLIQNIKITKKRGHTRIQFSRIKNTFTFQVSFNDEASIENCMHCITMALHLGLSEKEIQNGLDQLYAVDMRLQMLAGENQCVLINDAYTADIESLKAGLDFQDRQRAKKSKTVILSDLLQTGKGSSKLYQQIADLLSQYKVNKVIGIGQEVLLLDKYLNNKTRRSFYKDTAAYLHHYQDGAHLHEIILVKGARRFRFEQIIDRLMVRQHDAALQVDLSAMMHNVSFFQSQLKKKTKLLAIIKASGYGSGAIQVANLLEKSKVDYFGVAYVDEGIALRKKGILKPILVLNCQAPSFGALIAYQLEPEIYSISQLKELISFLGKDQKVKVHLKIDTGMNRLGFVKSEWAELSKLLITAKKQIKVQSIFTHLAASDVPAEDAFSKSQVKLYNSAYASITKRIKTKPDKHVLNTSGILRFPQYGYDMVRLGLGLYGINPTNQVDTQLQEVLTFKASISQIKHLSPGDTVGYNRKGRIRVPKKIAIINVGYADGLLRKAGNGRFKVWINGQLAPTIGNICMDMSMIDISKIEDIKVNDQVVLFGKDYSVQHLCKALDTIPYEIYTSISERIKRVYYQE